MVFIIKNGRDVEVRTDSISIQSDGGGGLCTSYANHWMKYHAASGYLHTCTEDHRTGFWAREGLRDFNQPFCFTPWPFLKNRFNLSRSSRITVSNDEVEIEARVGIEELFERANEQVSR